jgi:hypothetical protein
MKHPEFSEILDYFEDRLAPASKKRIQSHFDSGCARCQGDLDWISRNLGLIKSESALYDAPENLVQRAIDAFPVKRLSMRDWVKARLQFDSWAVPQATGLRSENQGSRQWIYLTDTYKIYLMLDSTVEGHQMIGQLTSDNPENDVAGCLVELIRNDTTLDSVFTNEHGEFLLTAVPSQFELKIHGSLESFIVSLT